MKNINIVWFMSEQCNLVAHALGEVMAEFFHQQGFASLIDVSDNEMDDFFTLMYRTDVDVYIKGWGKMIPLALQDDVDCPQICRKSELSLSYA